MHLCISTYTVQWFNHYWNLWLHAMSYIFSWQ